MLEYCQLDPQGQTSVAFNRYPCFSIQRIVFENVVCVIADIMSRERLFLSAGSVPNGRRDVIYTIDRLVTSRKINNDNSPRALGWMVEKICNKLIFSGIVQQSTMNDISKIPWNPNCGNYKILCKISFLVSLSLGQIPACLMTWFAPQGLSPLPQHSLFHTPHMMWLAACQALRDGADAVVWNSLCVSPEWLQLTTLSYRNIYLVTS